MPYSPTQLRSIVDQFQQKPGHALSVKAAKSIIEKYITPISENETLGIFSAVGRVLATDIISSFNVPPHDNSAMDGYAFNGQQLQGANTLTLRVIGDAFAGHPYHGSVNLGECVRIMTGAVMPSGCDTVVPQEMIVPTHNTNAADSHHQDISFNTSTLHAGDNRRLAGEDLAANQVALPCGHTIGAAQLGLIASLGIAEVKVYRPLRVAYFSTGDEVCSLGETLKQGSIYDSNRYTVFALLRQLGIEVIDLGVVPDRPDALESTLQQACLAADAVITSGGVSVGAADYTKEVMAKLGEVDFWTISMRPGRPMAFGRINYQNRSAYLFGLPGNPVAAMVSFLYFVQDALLHMQGALPQQRLLVPARSTHSIRKRQGRTEYQRGIVALTHEGQLEVRVTGSQGSGVLRSMSEANCMIVLPDEQADVSAGDIVQIHLFSGLLS